MSKADWQWKINGRIYDFESAEREVRPAIDVNHSPAENLVRLSNVTAVDGSIAHAPFCLELHLQGASWNSPRPLH